MELIKKYYQKFISYGLITFGVIIFMAILVIRPSRLILQETDNYNQKAELKSVNFPFSQSIKIPAENISFLELRFGNDSINQYQYTITATHESNIIFSHTYINEISNIVRIPIDATIKLNPYETIDIKIDCKEDCKKAKFDLYNIDSKESVETLYGFRKTDFGLLWYGLFPVTLGFTLLPLIKKGKKSEK